MKIDKTFFWLGLCMLIVAIEFFILTKINTAFLFSAIFMLISALLFLYLGRFHFMQILYHFYYEEQMLEAEEKLDKLNVEISRKNILFEKLKNELEKMEETKQSLKKAPKKDVKQKKLPKQNL